MSTKEEFVHMASQQLFSVSNTESLHESSCVLYLRSSNYILRI